jgi:hypothetical protein
MAAKKPSAEEAALDAQLFAMMETVGAVEVDEEAPKKPAATKPVSNGWGPKK